MYISEFAQGKVKDDTKGIFDPNAKKDNPGGEAKKGESKPAGDSKGGNKPGETKPDAEKPKGDATAQAKELKEKVAQLRAEQEKLNEQTKAAQPKEFYKEDWHDPKTMHEHGEEQMSDAELREAMIISTDPGEHVERIREVEKLGATTVALMNNSGADPHAAIELYGREVLPKLSRSPAPA